MNAKTSGAYLKAIYMIQEDGRNATTQNIAKALGVKPASVTEMLGKLALAKYVTHSPYRETKLTSSGRHEALKIMRKHRLLETFLGSILKLEGKEMESQASALEHSLTDRADQQLCIFLNRPMHSPQNKEIPHCGKKMTCQQCLKSGC